MQRNRREAMSPVDSAWLRMEDPTNLMMITGVLIFETPLNLERFRQVIEQRLLQRFDRFRKRAVVPAQGSNPYWEDDPFFTLSAHLHRVALPLPADQHALQDLTSDLMSTPIDFSKPPWQFHIVEQYGQGSALIVRLHHCIADGIALVHVLLSLTDSTADRDRAAEPPTAPKPRDPLSALLAPVQQLSETVLREGQNLIERPAERVQDIARLGADSLAALGKLVLQSPDPQTALKGPLGVLKRATWSQPIPLEQIKAIGRVTGATINDILLAAVTGALRSYLIWRGTDVNGLNIRAVVPVNLRPLDRPPTMGNQFGVVFLALPVGIADPYARLTELRERMDQIKGTPEAVVAFGILNAMGISPQPLQDIGVGLFGSKATAVMTNVPGPRETIYMAGSPIRDIMFWVPQSGHLGVGVSILSYAGQVLVGLATDTDLIPEPERIIAAYQHELDMLSELMPPIDLR
jgi:WS/DGAT/MGAT family acyltransferase